MVLHSDFDTNAAAQLGTLLELDPTSSKVGRYTRLILKKYLYSTDERYSRPALLPVQSSLLNLVFLGTFGKLLVHLHYLNYLPASIAALLHFAFPLFILLTRIHSYATLVCIADLAI